MNFQDTAFGATLTLIGTFVVFALAAPTKRAWTRVRNFYRGLIGQTAFEEITVQELSRLRIEMRSVTEPQHYGRPLVPVGLAKQCQDTRELVRQQRDMIQAQVIRTNRARKEVEELGIQLRAYTDTLGPIWNTAEGHRMPMRLLSAPHLNNILRGDFGGHEAQEFAKRELDRRRIDKDWRDREAAGEAAPTMQELGERGARARLAAKEQSEAMGRARRSMRQPLRISPDDQRRVTNFSPLWARTLITRLRTDGSITLDRETSSRVYRVLPVWTRDIIADILERNAKA